MQTFFVQSFSTTLRVMDVRTENRGRAHQKVRFPAAPMVARNFLTPGHPGVRVRNVRGKSGPKSLGLCCFFFSESSLIAALLLVTFSWLLGFLSFFGGTTMPLQPSIPLAYRPLAYPATYDAVTSGVDGGEGLSVLS